MKMTDIVVSVILPVYNAEKWLDECLQSIYDQDFELSLELSVCNDCSTDTSANIIKNWFPRLQEKGIKCIIGHDSTGPNGVGSAKNKAVEQSCGEFLCFFDADDVMFPSRISRQYQAARDLPKNTLIGSQFTRTPPGSTERYTKWANSLKHEQLYSQIYTSHGPTIIMPTWFCHRSVFTNVAGFNTQGKGTPEDLLFFYKHLRLGGRLHRVDDVLLSYRYHLSAATFSVHEDTIWEIRVKALEENVLCNWDTFTIWNAGKQGRKLFRSLTKHSQQKVKCFCDVDEKKIAKGYYIYEETKILPKPKIPIIHFRGATAPFILCIKQDLTGGSFEENLQSLSLQEEDILDPSSGGSGFPLFLSDTSGISQEILRVNNSRIVCLLMEDDELALSDVHVGCSHVAVERTYADMSYEVMMSRFVISFVKKEEIPSAHDHKAFSDEDGDIVVSRKTNADDVEIIYIEHAMSTRLKDVGLQVWAGCLLLCDFILHRADIFSGKNIIDLGAGTGLSSIIAAKYAGHVFCTDIGKDVLHICEQNVKNNREIVGRTPVKVKEMNWNECQVITGCNKFEWHLEDLEILQQTDIVIACDVIYNDSSTEALFRTVRWLAEMHPSLEIFIALEKRLNFTLADLDVVCPAYTFFQQQLKDLSQQPGNTTYCVQEIPCDFPQFLQYTRIKYLELWHIATVQNTGYSSGKTC